MHPQIISYSCSCFFIPNNWNRFLSCPCRLMMSSHHILSPNSFSLSSYKHTRPFLIPSSFSRFLCFRLLRPLVLPSFPFVSFLFYLFSFYSSFLSTSCSLQSARSRAGRSGVKKGLFVSRESNVGHPARSAICVPTTSLIYYEGRTESHEQQFFVK